MNEAEGDEQARWEEIVANYGEPSSSRELDEILAAPSEPPVDRAVAAERGDEVPEWWEREPEGFVPPTPPPLPRTDPIRMVAWVLLIGGPALLVLSAVFRVGLPRVLVLGLIAAILVSFGFLLRKASAAPREPWDDGAQV